MNGLPTTTDREWRSRAACRRVDPELFFPAAEDREVVAAQVAAAKAVCAGCPVRMACLDEALTRLPYGIAGGLTSEERRRLRTHVIGRRPAHAASLGSVEVDEVQVAGSRTEVAVAGRRLLAAGRCPRTVARLCGVTERTVQRWAACPTSGAGVR